jgi:hypothetical protein
MTIAVICSCGKSMRAPAEWAGRAAKCPGCGQAVHIPGPAGHGAAPAPVRNGNPPVVPCPSCGKPLMVPPGMAGKLVACPACGGHVTLPGKPAGVTAKAPRMTVPATAPAPAGRPKSKPPQPARKPAKLATFEPDDGDADFEYDEDDEGDRRPARRGKKNTRGKKSKAGINPVVLWGGIGGAAVLVLGLAVGLVMAFRGGGSPSGALALVPADSVGFMLVRAGDFNKTPSADTIRKMVGVENEAKFGIPISDIRDVVLIVTAKSMKPTGLPIVAISTAKPISIDAIAASELGKPLTKKEVGGKTLFAGGQANPQSMLLHEPNMLLMGDEADITALSAAPPKADVTGLLTPKLRAAAAGSDMFFFGYQVSPEMRQMAGPMGAGGMPGFKLTFVNEVQGGFVAMTEDKTIHGRLSLEFVDGAKAGKAKEELDATLGMVRTMMLPNMKGMPGMNPRLMTIAEKAIEKARPFVTGNSVEIPLEYETTIGELIDQAKPMMGMFGPGMGGPGMGAMPGPPPGPPPFPQPQPPLRKKR